MNTDLEIKLFIVNLGKYTEGISNGEWVTLPLDNSQIDELLDRLQVCHHDKKYYSSCGNPYEEIAIHDYETNIKGLEITECSNIRDLNDALINYESYLSGVRDDVLNSLVRAIILNTPSITLTDAVEDAFKIICDSDYIIYSEVDDMSDIARVVLEESYDRNTVPDVFWNNFDYESFGEELETESTYVWIDDKTCVNLY